MSLLYGVQKCYQNRGSKQQKAGKTKANHCDAMLSLNGRTSRLKLENYEVK